jgi:hypothetical protein
VEKVTVPVGTSVLEDDEAATCAINSTGRPCSALAVGVERVSTLVSDGCETLTVTLLETDAANTDVPEYFALSA